LIEAKFGTPTGFKERVLAILTDSSTSLRTKLSVLGFNWVPLGNFWARGGELQPHVVKVSESFGVQPSQAVKDEYNQKILYKSLRIFEPNFRSDMLLDYQKESLDFCIKSGSGIVALDIGLGKTPLAIGYADHLGLKNLVVCPASLRSQWYSELSKFNYKEPSKMVIDGTRAKRKQQWKESFNYQYVICSYDLLRQEVDLASAKSYLQGGLLICDEIMRVKTSSSQRTKAIKDLRNSALYAIGLSGTPVENNLAEFYTILNIVSPNFIPSYERFAELFLVRELRQGHNGRSYWQILGEKNVDEFREIIKPLVIRKEKRECLSLPPASTVIRKVELSKEQKRIEKRLLELAKEDPDNVLKYFTYARENVISPDLVPVKVLEQPMGLSLWGIDEPLEYTPSKVEELLSGKIRPDQIELTPRLQEVSDIICESGREKLIIYSPYVKSLEVIKRCILKEPCSMLIGGCNVTSELERFRSEENRILLMSSAGEEGHNLQMASLMLVLSKPYNPAKLSQLFGRIERKGQSHPMTFYELRSPSLIEARINKILEKKEKLSEKVLAKRVME